MALALYRKYRPRTFAEVIGQDHVTEPLSQALRSGRLHHAYLFSGPRGCGKTSSARILARSLNCVQGPTPDPCGVCASCKSLANDGTGSIDVIEIDAASHGGVDDARELREKAFFAPASSRYKIYVIDEAHMVSSAGFNALLKLVEEPPDYVKFIFATTEPEKVLGTIRSRTHHYPFRLIPPAVLRPYLKQLTEAEGIHVEPAVFPLVVRAGGGSARDSLSLLDQLIAGAGPEGVGYARAVALLGVTDVALIDEMCDALAVGDGAAAYATIDRVAEAGHDPRRFASDLLERFRDLIIMQQVPDAVSKGLIDGPADQLDAMSAQATRLGPATLSRCADIVHNGLVEMRGTTAPRLLLELITARMLLPGADDSTGALLQRLERMERRLTLSDTQPHEGVRPQPASLVSEPEVEPAAGTSPSYGGLASADRPDDADSVSSTGRATQGESDQAAAIDAPAAETQARQVAPQTRRPEPAAILPDAPEQPEDEPVSSGAPGQLTAAAVREVWPEIITAVGRQSKKVAALAAGATVRDLDGQTVVLTFRFPAHARMVSDQPQLISDALYESLGGRWQIRCEVTGEGGGARRGDAGAPSRSAALAPDRIPPTRSAASAPRSRQRAVSPPAATADEDGGDRPEPAGPGVTTAEYGDRPESARPGAKTAEDGDWPEPARLGATAAEGGDWPEPARLGGSTSVDEGGDPANPVRSPAGQGGDPESIRHEAGPAAASQVGGAIPANRDDGVRPADPRESDARLVAAVRAGGRGGAVGPAEEIEPSGVGMPGGGVTAAVTTGLAAARAAAAGATRQGGTKAPAATSPHSSPWSDGSPAEEAPYDPEYDGPPPPGAAYEGFHPGDEPLDDVIDEKTARQNGEQQAMQLLREAFGAEKIGEV